MNPCIDYENASKLAREALRTGRSVADPVLEIGLLDQTMPDSILRPNLLTAPRKRT